MSVDEATRVVEVWPDNVLAVNTFTALATQWRVGVNGAVGLDYGAIPAVLRLTGVPRAEWPAVFDGLRVMEDAALAVMREQRKK